MGTRSLTVVYDEYTDKEIIVLYRQYDGYPEGHGEDLKEFLKDFTITNGISDIRPSANGMGCLAAQIVCHFKKDVGGFYLHSSGTRNVGEEYIYHIILINNELQIDIEEVWGYE